LKPDLIIANKEENTKEYVEKLADICPVYVSEVNDFDSSIEMMLSIGKITDKEDESNRLVEYIKKEFDSLSIPNQQTKVAYCIWKNPWMWAGSANYISNMLELCGFKNVIDIQRYPEISMDDIINKKPELVFLSSEPFPFKEEHISELKKQYPNTNFKIVDGEMFSWYGSRMLKLPNYAQLLLSEIESETI
jgi:ABC-type Fe3+-hydroxamate transport system substrate-binding protein